MGWLLHYVIYFAKMIFSYVCFCLGTMGLKMSWRISDTTTSLGSDCMLSILDRLTVSEQCQVRVVSKQWDQWVQTLGNDRNETWVLLSGIREAGAGNGDVCYMGPCQPGELETKVRYYRMAMPPLPEPSRSRVYRWLVRSSGGYSGLVVFALMIVKQRPGSYECTRDYVDNGPTSYLVVNPLHLPSDKGSREIRCPPPLANRGYNHCAAFHQLVVDRVSKTYRIFDFRAWVALGATATAKEKAKAVRFSGPSRIGTGSAPSQLAGYAYDWEVQVYDSGSGIWSDGAGEGAVVTMRGHPIPSNCVYHDGVVYFLAVHAVRTQEGDAAAGSSQGRKLEVMAYNIASRSFTTAVPAAPVARPAAGDNSRACAGGYLGEFPVVVWNSVDKEVQILGTEWSTTTRSSTTDRRGGSDADKTVALFRYSQLEQEWRIVAGSRISTGELFRPADEAALKGQIWSVKNGCLFGLAAEGCYFVAGGDSARSGTTFWDKTRRGRPLTLDVAEQNRECFSFEVNAVTFQPRHDISP